MKAQTLTVTLVLFLVSGCANPTAVSTPSVTTVGQVSNTAEFMDDNWVSNFQGVTPSNAQIDDSGISVQTAGLGTALNAGGIVGLWSPKDVEINDFEMTVSPEGLTSFKASSIKTTVSNVIGMYTAQVEAVTKATENMTKIEAERYVNGLEQAGKITSDVAELLKTTLLPTLPE